ncbi:MAG TPA: HAMP domain-containing protein, partial [Candidatus Ozemobacteraceae bacterium]|nr:HAMP domain-containing protein [Candidatus Ozemobacteraceae bacterium]
GQLLAAAQRHRETQTLRRFGAQAQLLAEHLLGPLVTLRDLRESLFPGIFVAHTNAFPESRSIWFRMPERGPGMLVQFEESFFRQGQYWPIPLRHLNRHLRGGIRLGWTSFWQSENNSGMAVPAATPFSHELEAAIAQFRQSQETEIDTPHYLVVCRAMPQHGVLFAFQPLVRLHERSNTTRRVWHVLLIGLFLTLSLWGFRAFVQERVQFVSIRWQISAAFLFATSLPLTGMGFLAHEYLQHRESDLRNSVFLRSEQFLRQIDSRFSSTLLETQTAFASLTATVSSSLRPQTTFSRSPILASGIAQLNTSEFYLVNDDETPILTQEKLLPTGRPLSSGVDKEQRLFSAVLAALFRDLTGTAANPRKNLALNELIEDFMGRESTEEFRNTMILQLGRISLFSNMDKRVVIMLSPLTEGLAGPLRYLALAQWSQWKLQRQHILRTRLQAARDRRAPRFFAVTTHSFQLVPENTPDPRPLNAFSERVRREQRTVMDAIGWNGRSWLAVGVPGQHLSSHHLLALTPQTVVEKRMLRLKRLLLTIALLALLITIMIATVLSRSILMPIQRLAAATTAIERRQFDFRVTGLARDEFGDLGQVFNRALEGFGELQTAGEVQGSLFPGRLAAAPGVEAGIVIQAGRQLGGAFAEVVTLSNQQLLLTFGSVGATGVRGALTLAMLKSLLTRRLSDYSLVHAESEQLRVWLLQLLSGNQALLPRFASVLLNPADGTIACNPGGFSLYSGLAPFSAAELWESLSTLAPESDTGTSWSLPQGHVLILATSAFATTWREARDLGLLPPLSDFPSTDLTMADWRAHLDRHLKALPHELTQSGEVAVAFLRRN